MNTAGNGKVFRSRFAALFYFSIRYPGCDLCRCCLPGCPHKPERHRRRPRRSKPQRERQAETRRSRRHPPAFLSRRPSPIRRLKKQELTHPARYCPCARAHRLARALDTTAAQQRRAAGVPGPIALQSGSVPSDQLRITQPSFIANSKSLRI